MESWGVSLSIAIVGWVIALFGYVYHQGLKAQQLRGVVKQLGDLQDTVAKDERIFTGGLDLLRKEITGELRNLFFDADGNDRVMVRHTCELSQKGCLQKFEYLTEDLKTSTANQIQRDNEIFSRIRGIEEKMELVGKSIASIETSLGIITAARESKKNG